MLERVLEDSARAHGERTALVAGDRRLTYAALDARAEALAHQLRAAGVARGDRVALFLDNVVEMVVAIFAALKAGAAFLPMHPTTKGPRLVYKLKDAGARALVLPAAKLAATAPLLAQCPELGAVVVAGSAPPAELPAHMTLVALPETDEAPAGLRLPREHIDADLACLLYTSGSTGDPKGVMLLHRNVLTVTRAVVEYLRLSREDVVCVVLPLSFGYGLTQLFSTLAAGGTVVLEKGMAFPHLTLTRMISERVTGFAMVPTIAAVLLGMDLSKYDLSTLRFITNAGDALPVEHAKNLRAALPDVDVVCMYGQTECMRVAYLEPADFERKLGSVGRGMPNQEVWLVDEDGVETPPGEPGELVVRGSHVMAGYWNQPSLTELKLRPGRLPGERVLYTGDLFRRDADGYLWFVARKDDVIKSKGEKVSPREVEEALLRMPGVAEAAVVGVPDPVFGLAIKAVVVPKAGVELVPRQVQGHCAQQLEDYMVPKIVEIRSELPKTDTGKVLRRELR